MAIRPEKNAAPQIAAVPYDVVTAHEAALCIAENPLSFLRVTRPDAELPDLAPDDEQVYRRARENFDTLLAKGLLLHDSKPAMYVYRVISGDVSYTGLGCCLDTRDYEQNIIRRHELTRYDKEEDRTKHIDAVNAHTGPVVLLYRDAEAICSLVEAEADKKGVPDAEVKWPDGTVHQIFRIDDEQILSRLEDHFSGINALYIADGHHRAKSAVNVAHRRQRRGEGSEETGRFLGVLFAHNRVKIHGYSRLLTDLRGYSQDEFLKKLREHYDVRPYGEVDDCKYQISPMVSPSAGVHIVHMYLGGQWYECTSDTDPDAGIIESLDVSILQKKVLFRILDITDPRGDSRLQYLGGARPLADLQEMVDSGDFVAAFAMQPVNVETVLDIADAGGIMPPKSTWFEPKLLSGLIVHTLD